MGHYSGHDCTYDPVWETSTAHGNSLRALVKFLDDVSDDENIGLNISTGVPLVYELDADQASILRE